MKFKVGDLITGTDKALSNFQDIDLSDQAVLEVTEIDDDEYYCIIISNQIDDSNVGNTITFYGDDERFFTLVTSKEVKITEKSWMEEAEEAFIKAEQAFSKKAFSYTPDTIKVNTSLRLSSTKLLKAKGLI